jgi:hypothetical protein
VVAALFVLVGWSSFHAMVAGIGGIREHPGRRTAAASFYYRLKVPPGACDGGAGNYALVHVLI